MSSLRRRFPLKECPCGLRRAHLPLAAAIALAIAAAAAPSHAQVRQRSFSLNETAPGNEYLSVAAKNGLEGNSAYTIEAWVYPTSYDNFPTIVGNDFIASYWLGLNTTGKVRFYPRDALSGFVETTQTVPLNKWTHVAAVYNSAAGYAIYLDGVVALSGSSITGAVGTSLGDLRIGADRADGVPLYFWRGYLDDVRIWNVTRTTSQVRSTMYVGVGNPSRFASGVYNGLEAAWANDLPYPTHVNDYGGGVFNDATFVNGNSLTHTTHFGPPVAPNVAIALNGVDDRVVLPVPEDFGRGITLMAWIAPTDVSGYPTIVGRDFNTSFWLGVTPWGALRFYPTGGIAVDGLTSISVGDRWTHVAATYDGERTILYINGEVDVISTSVSGPVGANGRTPWVGADNGAYGLGYPFAGYLDEVAIVQGVMGRDRIRYEMFHGLVTAIQGVELADVNGEWVRAYHSGFDMREDYYEVLGSNARLVRGGTPKVDHLVVPATLNALPTFAWNFGGGSTLPEDDLAASVGSQIDWPLDEIVGDVRVFVSAPLADLSQSKIRLRSPSGTWVALMNSSAGVGRDLLTVIADDATTTWETGFSPYHGGVRPSEPLSAFDGENGRGTWRLEISGAGTGGVGLWSWALQVNRRELDVEPVASAAIALRLAGPNPVRGSGAVALELPEAAAVDLALLDIQGRQVLPLLTGRQTAGSHRVGFTTEGLAAGIYFARLRVDGRERTSLKLTVVR